MTGSNDFKYALKTTLNARSLIFLFPKNVC